MKRLVVLISGFGSNLQAIIDACAHGELATHAEVVAVFSNKADAFGLQRAIDAGIPAIALPFYKDLHFNRAGYDEVLADVIAQYSPDLIVCAGWMRIFSPAFVRTIRGQDHQHSSGPARHLPRRARHCRCVRCFRAWRDYQDRRDGALDGRGRGLRAGNRI